MWIAISRWSATYCGRSWAAGRKTYEREFLSETDPRRVSLRAGRRSGTALAGGCCNLGGWRRLHHVAGRAYDGTALALSVNYIGSLDSHDYLSSHRPAPPQYITGIHGRCCPHSWTYHVG